MGGCKCTYRNCNVKSDGKTHMFHYPVFEKIRCHQWLINAHRLDFLDLKVSQLKNRVVCQHHFKDDNFMNFKKDKLTFDAIPTEDGPYCDPSNYVDTTKDSSKLYSIIVDDIENDLNGGDKKANFSLKYGDFLTNFDFAEIGNEDNISYKHNNTCINKSPLEENKKDKVIDESSVFYRLSLTEKSAKKAQNQPMLVVSPYVNSSNISQSDSIKSLKPDSNVSFNSTLGSSIRDTNVKNNVSPQKVVKKQPKIRIISEKKITNPLSITGTFQPVSPNFVLNSSKIKKDKIVSGKDDSTKTVPDLKVPSLDETKQIEIEIGPMISNEIEKPQPTNSVNIVQEDSVVEKPAKKSLLHPKVDPERAEAINKKRKFNMKLKEVIQSCLDKLDNSDVWAKSLEKYEPEEDNKSTRSPPNELSMSNSQDYTIQFLEARMRKMENTLLQKIEQNSKKIIDLKNTYIKATAEKKSNALNRFDEEAHKKQLFQEISKYLSPSSKSLVYEELFIDKFALNEPTTSIKRKRGRRVS